MKLMSETICSPVTAAARQAGVFLLPPAESAIERGDHRMAAATLARQAIEYAVRAGREDMAFALLDIAQELEAGA